jgi:nitrogen-specific signal transduction histidine kinase
VKEIVESYDGSVTVTSINNRTVFTIKLPKVINSKNDISNA